VYLILRNNSWRYQAITVEYPLLFPLMQKQSLKKHQSFSRQQSGTFLWLTVYRVNVILWYAIISAWLTWTVSFIGHVDTVRVEIASVTGRNAEHEVHVILASELVCAALWIQLTTTTHENASTKHKRRLCIVLSTAVCHSSAYSVLKTLHQKSIKIGCQNSTIPQLTGKYGKSCQSYTNRPANWLHSNTVSYTLHIPEKIQTAPFSYFSYA